MKHHLLFIVLLSVMPFLGFAQATENLDYISPFHNGLAAIKKDGKWAFINTKGDLVLSYRADVALSTFNENDSPMFYNDRCLIEEQKNGISYFGYIDTAGKVIIEPQFLNATPFNNGHALALTLIKETVAQNRALNKSIVYYKYYEVVIDLNGKMTYYLNPSGINVVLDRDFIREPSIITSQFIADNLVAVKRENRKWALVKLN